MATTIRILVDVDGQVSELCQLDPLLVRADTDHEEKDHNTPLGVRVRDSFVRKAKNAFAGMMANKRFSWGDGTGDEIRRVVGRARGLKDDNDNLRELTIEEAENAGRDAVIAEYQAALQAQG